MGTYLSLTEKGRRIHGLMKDKALFDEASRNVGADAELPVFIAELERLDRERKEAGTP